MPRHTDCENEENWRHKGPRVFVTFVTIWTVYTGAAFQYTVWWLWMKRYVHCAISTVRPELHNTMLIAKVRSKDFARQVCHHIFSLKTKQWKNALTALLYFKGAVCKKIWHADKLRRWQKNAEVHLCSGVTLNLTPLLHQLWHQDIKL